MGKKRGRGQDRDFRCPGRIDFDGVRSVSRFLAVALGASPNKMPETVDNFDSHSRADDSFNI